MIFSASDFPRYWTWSYEVMNLMKLTYVQPLFKPVFRFSSYLQCHRYYSRYHYHCRYYTTITTTISATITKHVCKNSGCFEKSSVLNIYASGHYASTFTYSTTITATIVVMEAVGLALIRLVFLPMATELAWLIAFMLQVMIKPKELSNEMKDFTCFEPCEKQNAN